MIILNKQAMKDLKNYIETHKQLFLDELFSFLKIPSVSAKPEHKEDMAKACLFLQEKIKKAGADICEVHTTKGHPIV